MIAPKEKTIISTTYDPLQYTTGPTAPQGGPRTHRGPRAAISAKTGRGRNTRHDRRRQEEEGEFADLLFFLSALMPRGRGADSVRMKDQAKPRLNTRRACADRRRSRRRGRRGEDGQKDGKRPRTQQDAEQGATEGDSPEGTKKRRLWGRLFVPIWRD